MPHQLADNEIIQLRIYTTLGNQTAINRLNFNVNNHTGTSATDLEFVTQWEALLAPLFKACISQGVIYRGMQAQKVFPLPVIVSQTSVANAGLGTRGSVPQPGNVAGIVKWLTANAGRKFRGRMYMPWPATADVVSTGNPSASYLTALLSFSAPVVAGLTISGSGGGTAGTSPQIRHKDNTIDAITGNSVETVFGSMKRRGGFGRPNFSPI